MAKQSISGLPSETDEARFTKPPKYKAEDIKLTTAEIRNGWTQETLANYFNEREDQAATSLALAPKRKEVKVENVKNSFDPHKWL